MVDPAVFLRQFFNLAVHHNQPITVSFLDRRRGRENTEQGGSDDRSKRRIRKTSDTTLSAGLTLSTLLLCRNLSVLCHLLNFFVHLDQTITVSSLGRRRGRETLSREGASIAAREGFA
jgi:hypothetical protein